VGQAEIRRRRPSHPDQALSCRPYRNRYTCASGPGRMPRLPANTATSPFGAMSANRQQLAMMRGLVIPDLRECIGGHSSTSTSVRERRAPEGARRETCARRVTIGPHGPSRDAKERYPAPLDRWNGLGGPWLGCMEQGQRCGRRQRQGHWKDYTRSRGSGAASIEGIEAGATCHCVPAGWGGLFECDGPVLTSGEEATVVVGDEAVGAEWGPSRAIASPAARALRRIRTERSSPALPSRSARGRPGRATRP